MGQLIGIAGQKGMGKDTVADLICERCPHFRKTSFAAGLKELVSSHFGVSAVEIEAWKNLSTPPPQLRMSIRCVLQQVGQLFRDIDPEVWVKRTMVRLEPHAIISDLRYDNEFAALRHRNAAIVLVGRSSCLTRDPHPSEASVYKLVEWFLQNTKQTFVCVSTLTDIPEECRKIDYFIRNDGSMDEVRHAVDQLLLLHGIEETTLLTESSRS